MFLISSGLLYVYCSFECAEMPSKIIGGCRNHEEKGSKSKRSRPERLATSTDEQTLQEPGPLRSRGSAIAIEDVATVHQCSPPTPVPAIQSGTSIFLISTSGYLCEQSERFLTK